MNKNLHHLKINRQQVRCDFAESDDVSIIEDHFQTVQLAFNDLGIGYSSIHKSATPFGFEWMLDTVDFEFMKCDLIADILVDIDPELTAQCDVEIRMDVICKDYNNLDYIESQEHVQRIEHDSIHYSGIKTFDYAYMFAENRLDELWHLFQDAPKIIGQNLIFDNAEDYLLFKLKYVK